MKNIRFFLSEIFHFLVVKFSIYLNRRVFVMKFLHYICSTELSKSLTYFLTASKKHVAECCLSFSMLYITLPHKLIKV